jgi:hypothetical protein
MAQTHAIGDREYKKFYGSKDHAIINVNDVTQSTKVESVSGEAITLAAGAAGTTGKFRVGLAPIMDSVGGVLGSKADTSVSVSGGTTLPGNEIYFNNYTNSTDIYATLANGDYAIDYPSGTVYYKKADSGTAITISYKHTTQKIDASGATIEVNLDAANDEVSVYGVYNAVEPSLTTGSLAQLQLNDKGQLKVTGGASSVTAQFKSPANFTATYTSSTTLTLSGISGFSITDSSQLVYIKVIPTTGEAKTFVNGSNGVTLRVSSNVVTIAGAGTPFASGDVYEVGINALPFEQDPSTQSIKTSQLNMLNNYIVNETIVNTTNIAAATNYYPSSTGMSMDGFKDLCLSGVLIDADNTTTVTVEVANNPDPATATFHQIYGFDSEANANVNSVAASSSTKSFVWNFDNLNATWVRFKLVTGDATNTVRLFARRKAL